MPVPKRRTSKSRRDKRRTHYKLNQPGISVCPKCKQPKPPHRVCPHCGEYKGRKIIETKA
ncbi:MAG: 50S ribosomal protein L32 [bacterium]|nr:50S ribosomal protein L32 [bacterium]